MTMLLPKEERIRDKNWLIALRAYPCIVSGQIATEYMGIDPHHLTLQRYSGGMKAGDNHALPLRHDLHLLISQQMSEVEFWRQYMDEKLMSDALKALAEKLYREWKNEA